MDAEQIIASCEHLADAWSAREDRPDTDDLMVACLRAHYLIGLLESQIRYLCGELVAPARPDQHLFSEELRAAVYDPPAVPREPDHLTDTDLTAMAAHAGFGELCLLDEETA